MQYKAHQLIRAIWVAWSLWMAVSGFNTWTATNGTVYGSTFGMLISLANLAGMVLVWLLGFTLYWVTLPWPGTPSNSGVQKS